MPDVDTLMLRRAGVITLVVGVICTVIGGVVAGGTGALGGLLGTVLVVVFFSAGQAVVGRTIKNNPQMACTIAWTVAEVWVYSGTKVLYVEPERKP
jgi:ATP synthase protein I